MQANGTSAEPHQRATPGFISGIWVPLVTPFRDGQCDLESLKRLTDYLVTAGVRGFLVCGTSGEGSLLSIEERAAVVETVVSVAGRPVLAGAFGRHAEEIAVSSEAMRAAGAQGIAVLPPPYISLSPGELLDHFTEVANSSTIPVMLYNFPGQTPTSFDTDSVLQLSGHPNILGIKHSGPILDAELMRLMCSLPPGFPLMVGNPLFLMAAASVGGRGGINAAAHLEAPRLVRLWSLIEQGEWPDAQNLYREMFPSLFALRGKGAQLKLPLYEQGLISSPELRSPLGSVAYRPRGRHLFNQTEGIR